MSLKIKWNGLAAQELSLSGSGPPHCMYQIYIVKIHCQNSTHYLQSQMKCKWEYLKNLQPSK